LDHAPPIAQRAGADIGGGGGIGIGPVGAGMFPPPLDLGPASAAPGCIETGPAAPGIILPPPLARGPGPTGGIGAAIAGSGPTASRCNSCRLSWFATLSPGAPPTDPRERTALAADPRRAWVGRCGLAARAGCAAAGAADGAAAVPAGGDPEVWACANTGGTIARAAAIAMPFKKCFMRLFSVPGFVGQHTPTPIHFGRRSDLQRRRRLFIPRRVFLPVFIRRGPVAAIERKTSRSGFQLP
jgi:hypothetical protein